MLRKQEIAFISGDTATIRCYNKNNNILVVLAWTKLFSSEIVHINSLQEKMQQWELHFKIQ